MISTSRSLALQGLAAPQTYDEQRSARLVAERRRAA
jgi:hypothetical protein